MYMNVRGVVMERYVVASLVGAEVSSMAYPIAWKYVPAKVRKLGLSQELIWAASTFCYLNELNWVVYGGSTNFVTGEKIDGSRRSDLKVVATFPLWRLKHCTFFVLYNYLIVDWPLYKIGMEKLAGQPKRRKSLERTQIIKYARQQVIKELELFEEVARDFYT
jgi:hypothetical protein